MSEFRKCIEQRCGFSEFELTNKELDYFNSTIIDKKTGEEIQMKPPKRCPDCRSYLKRKKQGLVS